MTLRRALVCPLRASSLVAGARTEKRDGTLILTMNFPVPSPDVGPAAKSHCGALTAVALNGGGAFLSFAS